MAGEALDPMRPLSESSIVRDLAESVCRRITRRVLRSLQGMTDTHLSGDDSGLANVWDELCVQIQYEQSVYWDAYDQTVTSLIADEFVKLPAHEREAVWLQSSQGVDWSCDDEADREPAPVNDPDAVHHIVNEFVYAEAGRWSNSQIRDYLDRSY
jgi:hypothetical protein